MTNIKPKFIISNFIITISWFFWKLNFVFCLTTGINQIPCTWIQWSFKNIETQKALNGTDKNLNKPSSHYFQALSKVFFCQQSTLDYLQSSFCSSQALHSPVFTSWLISLFIYHLPSLPCHFLPLITHLFNPCGKWCQLNRLALGPWDLFSKGVNQPHIY